MLKNIFYVAMQQFVNTILPFLTIPYIARVLGVEQNGVYSYSLTTVNFFAVIFAFGFAIHGTNIIAQSSGETRYIKYIELQILRVIFLFSGLIIFIAFIILYPRPYDNVVFILQGLIIVASLFDNSWYYQGIGDFKKIVTRNIIIKFIGTISVFLLIKKPEDLWLYILLINGSQLVGNIILFFDTAYLFKYIKFLKKKSLWEHIKVSFLLFLPNMSVLLYSSFDKLLLGSSGDIDGLANYQQVQRIITFIYTFLMIPSPVLIQKVATMRAISQHKKADSIIEKGLNIYIVTGLFLAFGILLSSREFITLFLGLEYKDAINLFIIMGPVLIFKTVGGVIGGWYLIPLGKNKIHSFPLVIGTIISIILNLMVTPHYGATGATIIFVLTEFLVIIVQLFYSRILLKFVDIKILLIFFLIFIFAFLVTGAIYQTLFLNLINNVVLKMFINIFLFILISLTLSLLIKKTRSFIGNISNLYKER